MHEERDTLCDFSRDGAERDAQSQIEAAGKQTEGGGEDALRLSILQQRTDENTSDCGPSVTELREGAGCWCVCVSAAPSPQLSH